jgi:hypothetical protein
MAKFGLMDFKKVLGSSVSGKHAIAGAAAGTLGIGVVKFGLNSIKVGGLPLSAKIPAALQRWTPLLASLVSAGLGYVLLKKASPKNANSFAVGSLVAGTVLTVKDVAGQYIPALNDYVTYRLPGMGYVTPTSAGTLHKNPARLAGLANLGLIAPDHPKNPRLNGLAMSAMGDHNMDELVNYDIY